MYKKLRLAPKTSVKNEGVNDLKFEANYENSSSDKSQNSNE